MFIILREEWKLLSFSSTQSPRMHSALAKRYISVEKYTWDLRTALLLCGQCWSENVLREDETFALSQWNWNACWAFNGSYRRKLCSVRGTNGHYGMTSRMDAEKIFTVHWIWKTEIISNPPTGTNGWSLVLWIWDEQLTSVHLNLWFYIFMGHWKLNGNGWVVLQVASLHRIWEFHSGCRVQ